MSKVAVLAGVYRFDPDTDLDAAPLPSFVKGNVAQDQLGFSRYDQFVDLAAMWALVTPGMVLDAALANNANVWARYQIGVVEALVDWWRLTVARMAGGSGDPLAVFDPITVTVTPGGVAWITKQEVVDYLGQPVAADDAWLEDCTAAANEWAFRKRLEAGYVDDPAVSPGPDVSAGTVMYAGALFRARGAAEGFASFEDFAEQVPGSMGAGWIQVKRLLGIPRPVAV